MSSKLPPPTSTYVQTPMKGSIQDDRLLLLFSGFHRDDSAGGDHRCKAGAAWKIPRDGLEHVVHYS